MVSTKKEIFWKIHLLSKVGKSENREDELIFNEWAKAVQII